MRDIYYDSYSHPGLVRTNNEDDVYCDGEIITPETRDVPFASCGSADVPCLFAVCDGMGGEADGEVASLTAVRALADHADAIKRAAANGQDVDRAVCAYVADANARLCDMMIGRPVRMGTTLTLAVITASHIHTYNIGDSRIYIFKEGKLTQLTEDHTMAVQKVKMGLITKQEAERDRSRHVLTRYLGIFEDEMTLTPDAIPPIPADDRYRLLLCSDGLTDMVSDEQIEAILREAMDAKDAADALVKAALDNGGRDNVTCIVIDKRSEAN